ncbi:hypothetical protein HY251_19135 [bacterium]|nr:hypothetical protein [bacterium]
MLPPGETPLALGRAAPAPIEPTKDEIKALVRRLDIEMPPTDNVLAYIVARAVFDGDSVNELLKISRALGHVMRRPASHALQILTPALKRSGARQLFGLVRRALEAEAKER